MSAMMILMVFPDSINNYSSSKYPTIGFLALFLSISVKVMMAHSFIIYARINTPSPPANPETAHSQNGSTRP